MCKHLIREANKRLDNKPLTDLRFFLDLCRNHFPPYYTIPGIHTSKDTDVEEDQSTGDVVVIGVRGGALEQIQPQEARGDGPVPQSVEDVRAAGVGTDGPAEGQEVVPVRREEPADAAMGATMRDKDDAEDDETEPEEGQSDNRVSSDFALSPYAGI
jgi:hypothetical protein